MISLRTTVLIFLLLVLTFSINFIFLSFCISIVISVRQFGILFKQLSFLHMIGVCMYTYQHIFFLILCVNLKGTKNTPSVIFLLQVLRQKQNHIIWRTGVDQAGPLELEIDKQRGGGKEVRKSWNKRAGPVYVTSVAGYVLFQAQLRSPAWLLSGN